MAQAMPAKRAEQGRAEIHRRMTKCKRCQSRIDHQHVDEHGHPLDLCSWHLAISLAQELAGRDRGEEAT